MCKIYFAFRLCMAHNLTLPSLLWSLNVSFLVNKNMVFHLNLTHAHVHSPCHMEPTHQSVFSKSPFILSWGVSPLKCTNNSRWIKDVSLSLKSCYEVVVIVWLPCAGQLTELDFLTKYGWRMVGGPETYLSSTCWHTDPYI